MWSSAIFGGSFDNAGNGAPEDLCGADTATFAAVQERIHSKRFFQFRYIGHIWNSV